MEGSVWADQDRERSGIVEGSGVGIAEVPGQAVKIAEDVTTGAGRIAVTGCSGVVEEVAPVGHAGGFGIQHRHVRGFLLSAEVDDGDGVIESGEYVEQVARLVERKAAGSTA